MYQYIIPTCVLITLNANAAHSLSRSSTWTRVVLQGMQNRARSSSSDMISFITTLEKGAVESCNLNENCQACFSCVPSFQSGGVNKTVSNCIQFDANTIPSSNRSFTLPRSGDEFAFCFLSYFDHRDEIMLEERAACRECMAQITDEGDDSITVETFRRGPFADTNELVFDSCGTPAEPVCTPCTANEVQFQGSFVFQQVPTIVYSLTIPGVWECADPIACLIPPLCMSLSSEQLYTLTVSFSSFLLAPEDEIEANTFGVLSIQNTPFVLAEEDILRINATGHGSKTWCFEYDADVGAILLLDRECRTVQSIARPHVGMFVAIFTLPPLFGFALSVLACSTQVR